MVPLGSPVLSCSNNPDPLSHKQNSFYKDNVSLDNMLMHHFSSSPSKDFKMVKKLNHNASERNRRKKISSFTSSLRSLLPREYLTKKMSMPVTITRVLEYIPELEKQVEELTKKKEKHLLKISGQGNIVKKESQRKIPPYYNSDFVVSTSKLNDSEIAVHISSNEFNNTLLSEILLCLENIGLFLLNATSSKTLEGRIFNNLHFMTGETQRSESDILEAFVNIRERCKNVSNQFSCDISLRNRLLMKVCI